ncbi:MAG: MltA domain-containing protein [Pseudomonadota bacterium]
MFARSSYLGGQSSRGLILALCSLVITACATIQPTQTVSAPATPQTTDPIITAEVETVETPLIVSEPDTPPAVQPPPTTPPTEPIIGIVEEVAEVGLGAAVQQIDQEPILDRPDPFVGLTGWEDADLEPALAAFRRSCDVMARPSARQMLQNNDMRYGIYGDWSGVCRAARRASNARPFFESLFVPAIVSEETGLLTGYYETEIEVRAIPDAVYSEPILRPPADDTTRALPRAELRAESADVIAYGRPIDVFFLHVQGSGRLHFQNDSSLRVGYAGNNGHKYKSIGRVLIDRGEMTLDTSSKRSIEVWMEAAGPEAARDLMNENPRYIFFAEQEVRPDEGPKGAIQVPLTRMGSVAIDPKHRPYGVPVWLETRLPKDRTDHQGYATSLLVVTQDTGNAIRGPNRGDLFFGAGKEAGALAGMMKHPARWTVLIPRTLAERLSETQPELFS